MTAELSMQAGSYLHVTGMLAEVPALEHFAPTFRI